MKNQPLSYPAFKITNKNAAGIVFDLAWTENQAAPRLAYWISRAPGFAIEPNKPDHAGAAVYPEGKKSEVAADLSGPWKVNDLVTCKHSGAVARVAELKVNGADVEIQDGTNARSFVPEANFIDFDLLQRGAPAASSNAEPVAEAPEGGTPAPEKTAPRRQHPPRNSRDLVRRRPAKAAAAEPAAPAKPVAASKAAAEKAAHFARREAVHGKSTRPTRKAEKKHVAKKK